VKESAVSLSRLQIIESMIGFLNDGSMTFKEAARRAEAGLAGGESRPWGIHLAVLMTGFSSSFAIYRDGRAALLSAITALLVFRTGVLFLKSARLSGVFADFIKCTATFLVSGFFCLLAGVSVEACAIGALVIVAPGLTWVTAVSELADHDLVSGTSKLMRGGLTLLAMGTSYGICREGASHFFPSLALQAAPAAHPSFLTQILAMSMLTAGFSVLLDIPKRDYLAAFSIGLIGWLIARVLESPSSIILSVFSSSVFVGLASSAASRFLKSPLQIYAVPGILTLLPGMVGFLSFQSMVRGQFGVGVELSFKVFLLAGSIVFGLLSARLLTGDLAAVNDRPHGGEAGQDPSQDPSQDPFQDAFQEPRGNSTQESFAFMERRVI